MVVVGVRGEDADDAESLRIQRLCSIVRSSFEFDFDFYIDVLPLKIVENSSKLLAL